MEKTKDHYILITSSNFPTGGPSASYLNLFCRGLISNGFDIDVFLLKGYGFGDNQYKGPVENITEDGIHYTYLSSVQRPERFSMKLINDFISLFHLTALLLSLIKRRKSTRILLYNSDLFFNVPIHFISKLSGLKVYKFVAEIIDKSQYSNSLSGKLRRFAYLSNFKRLNKHSDKLIVFSNYLKQEFIKMGFDENKIIIQPNLTDFEYWAPVDEKIKYHIGYSGAPYRKDGLYDLLEAIKILKYRNIKVNLLVVGDVTFGKSLIPGYIDECRRHGIEDQVTFTGLVSSSKVKEYLSSCKILAVTRPDTIQTRAGFPTKLGEYFALKKPVLATKFGDISKYFTDGYDIILADCNDPSSIAKKIEWMIQNYNELDTLAERGYKTAWELLEFNNAMKRVVEFLNLS